MDHKKLSPKQQEKRNRILNSAIRLFAQNGLAATTVSEIAKVAGVSFGTVFTYFESKDALFESAIREPIAEAEIVFTKHDMDDRPIIEQIKDMIEDHIMFMAAHRDYLQLIQQVLGQPARFPELMERLDQFLLVMVEHLIPFIEKGIARHELDKGAPWVIAASYFSFLLGIRLTFVDSAFSELWKDFVPQALRLFGPTNNGS